MPFRTLLSDLKPHPDIRLKLIRSFCLSLNKSKESLIPLLNLYQDNGDDLDDSYIFVSPVRFIRRTIIMRRIGNSISIPAVQRMARQIT